MAEPANLIPADPIAALIELLKAQSIAAGRVFGGELPPAETALMPREAVVLRASGGISLTSGSNALHDTKRFDAFSYAATPHDAAQLGARVDLVLRLVERVVAANTLIHWVNSAGGYISGRDPESDWPRVFQSFQVFHALESIS